MYIWLDTKKTNAQMVPRRTFFSSKTKKRIQQEYCSSNVCHFKRHISDNSKKLKGIEQTYYNLPIPPLRIKSQTKSSSAAFFYFLVSNECFFLSNTYSDRRWYTNIYICIQIRGRRITHDGWLILKAYRNRQKNDLKSIHRRISK